MDVYQITVWQVQNVQHAMIDIYGIEKLAFFNFLDGVFRARMLGARRLDGSGTRRTAGLVLNEAKSIFD